MKLELLQAAVAARRSDWDASRELEEALIQPGGDPNDAQDMHLQNFLSTWAVVDDLPNEQDLAELEQILKELE